MVSSVLAESELTSLLAERVPFLDSMCQENIVGLGERADDGLFETPLKRPSKRLLSSEDPL